ncbi:MAG: ricin-type beta-trefoil lectin domain protein [Streptomycetaceae bacterium]|nr:ricin-type beta-trefoil lectin domain protein [Streptomycetaceae bacterium]
MKKTMLGVLAAGTVALTLTAGGGIATAKDNAHRQDGPAAPRQTIGSEARAAHRAVKSNAVGTYVVIHSLYSRTSGQCLDVDINAHGVNGNKVQVWACNGSAQQRWIAWNDYSVESVKYPGMCLDADTNGQGANGTKVQLWRCNASTQQKWYTRANDLAIYNWRFNNNNNTVLDRDNNVPGNGAKVQLWAKNYQSQQWWRVTAQ